MPNPWVKDFALILPSTTWWPKAKSPGLINNSLAKAKAFGSRKGLRQESLGLRQVLADCLWKSHKKKPGKLESSSSTLCHRDKQFSV
jgi:hypothetical protein